MQFGFLWARLFWRDQGHASTVLHFVHAHAACDITLRVRFISTFWNSFTWASFGLNGVSLAESTTHLQSHTEQAWLLTCYRLCREGDYRNYKEITKTHTHTQEQEQIGQTNLNHKPQTGQKLTQFGPRMCGSLIWCLIVVYLIIFSN